MSRLDSETREDLKDQLIHYRDEILYHYSSFRTEIFKFVKGHVDIETFRCYLLTLPAFTSPCCDEQCKLLSDSKELKQAKTVYEIFEVIEDFSSFLHWDIYAGIVNKFGGENDQKEMKEYSEHLEHYIDMHKVEEFVKINPKLKELKEDKKCVLKLATVLLPQKLSEVFVVKRAVAKILNLRQSALRFLSVEEGCVLLTFLVSVSVYNEIFSKDKELTVKQIANFQALKVQWIKCGDFYSNFEVS